MTWGPTDANYLGQVLVRFERTDQVFGTKVNASE